MCGRFTRQHTWAELHRLYKLSDKIAPTTNFQPRFNICPTTQVDAVVDDGERKLLQMRWGLIPSWWSRTLKDLKLATFNARAETVDTKPFFKAAFRKKRCIIPASGYYEWQHIDGDKKPQPWYFTQKTSPIISIAGIWDEWQDRESGNTIQSCAMIITEPNSLVAEVHDRMPVILQPEQFESWLSGALGKESLTPADDNVLQRWAVDKRVNSSRASDEDESLAARISL